MSNNEAVLDREAEEAVNARQLKKLKILYPLYQLMASMAKAFSTYVTYFYTNIFMFSVNFTAVITMTSSIISWIGTPVFAAFIDGFSFKKAKYWPWILIGSLAVNGGTMLIIALPALTGKTVELMYVVFIIRIVMTLLTPMSSTPMSGAFPKMAKDPRDRQYFGMSQKVGRDGGKTVFGYIVPAMLLAISGGGTEPTMKGYAITAAICYGAAILGFWMYALFGLRGSYVEKEGLAETKAKKANKVPISAMVKTITGNRAVLGMFLFFGLHKSYYFLYTSYASYVFRYVFQDFGMMGTFMTVFNFTAIVGVMFGPLWNRLWKESKKACAAAYITHIIFQIAILLTFSPDGLWLFLVLFGCSSFFMGMLETWVLPNFAAAADYGAWKAGARMDSLVMACYNLCMTACHLLTTLVATMFLNSFNYTEWLKAYKEGTVGITPDVIKGLSGMFTTGPLVLALLALAAFLFIYNMNDDRLRAVQKDLAEGKTAATSDLKM